MVAGLWGALGECMVRLLVPIIVGPLVMQDVIGIKEDRLGLGSFEEQDWMSNGKSRASGRGPAFLCELIEVFCEPVGEMVCLVRVG